MRARMEKGATMKRIRSRCVFASSAVAVLWVFYVYRFVSEGGAPANVHSTKFAARDALFKGDRSCEGRYIYLHDLPREFHEGLLDNCEALSLWSNICHDLVNMGFGQPMDDSDGVFSKTGWYATNQFMMELIFHHKVKNYECRTMDSSKANAIFVPFYSGIEVMPHLWDGANISHRDAVPYAFTQWVTGQPEWSRLDGHDHFLIGGRVTWDFRRLTDEESDWGNKLILLDPLKNMTTLTIEASPWHDEDVAVPYPTYFHPSTDQEVFDWQHHVANVERKALFCFAGAPRPEQDSSIRGQLMAHCKESEYCNLLECGIYVGKCHSPANVMRVFKESYFCLQPVGDSYTRRSLFDSILAGCIPVFFHELSAYTQYGWFFPADHSSYSVFIHEDFIRAKNVSVETVLRSYSLEEIKAMRKTVISLIPRILYAKPKNEMTLKDSFDISVDGVMERIREYRRRLEVDKKDSLALLSDPAKQEVLDAKARLDAMLRGGLRQK